MIWAGVALLALGTWGTYLLGLTIQELGALSRHIVSVRENTRRYQLQLDATAARMRACVRAGGTQIQCSTANPVPGPPVEPTSDRSGAGLPTWAILTLLGIGGAALLGGGLYIYLKGRSHGTLRIATRGLRGAKGALASGYNMEVE